MNKKFEIIKIIKIFICFLNFFVTFPLKIGIKQISLESLRPNENHLQILSCCKVTKKK